MQKNNINIYIYIYDILANLEFTIKKNGSISTHRTKENVDKFMDKIQEVNWNWTSLWFYGTYQRRTKRKIPFINIYNERRNRIAIYNKITREFITFCEPTVNEVKNLKISLNFGGQNDQNIIDPKNVIPQCSIIKLTNYINENQGFTLIHSFESDVLRITSVDPNSQIWKKYLLLNSKITYHYY